MNRRTNVRVVGAFSPNKHRAVRGSVFIRLSVPALTLPEPPNTRESWRIGSHTKRSPRPLTVEGSQGTPGG